MLAVEFKCPEAIRIFQKNGCVAACTRPGPCSGKQAHVDGVVCGFETQLPKAEPRQR